MQLFDSFSCKAERQHNITNAQTFQPSKQQEGGILP